jgi:putative SOS response-associated peptidase YedK
MCGRTTLKITPGDLEKTFGFPVPAAYRPSYNIAPTQEVLALSESRGERAMRLYRWGLIPYWAKEPSIGNRMINARAETVPAKPGFREAFARRRCLVIVDGYYEWMRGPGAKRPHRVHRPDDGPFTLAGLWDRWGDGERVIESCAIITTAANEHLAALHDRMPLVIRPEDRELWLSRETAEAELPFLLKPYTGDDLEMYEVSTLVNRPENDSEECILPIDQVELPETSRAGTDSGSATGKSRRQRAIETNYSLFNDVNDTRDGRV